MGEAAPLAQPTAYSVANDDIYSNLNGVLEAIWHAVNRKRY